MKILLVHCRYRLRGGEDAVFEKESQALRDAGHDIVVYEKSSSDYSGLSGLIAAFVGLFFSPREYLRLRRLMADESPDVVHVHNFFPFISPAVIYAANWAEIPVVMTLHNFRIICPSATFYINGNLNLASVNSCWSVLRYRCYKDSYLATFAMCMAIHFHRKLGTWRRLSGFIALTQFQKNIFSEWMGGEEKIYVKANFLDSTKSTLVDEKKGEYYIFAGRLSEEKGVRTLVDAFSSVESELRICGDGPLKELVEKAASDRCNVTYLGMLSETEVSEEIANAKALIIPSLWYEGFPMVVLEAFRLGVPVIASKIGSLDEIVRSGLGCKFIPGDSRSLVAALTDFENMDENNLSKKCLEEFESNYSKNKNINQLIEIYRDILF